MGHKVYISFKTEDSGYKEAIQSWDYLDYVDKSLNSPINSNDIEYILRKTREDYLRDSTVTVFLIGDRSAENLGEWEQQYIKRELQASLYNGAGNTKSGILGVVLPSMEDRIYQGSHTCSICGKTHNYVRVNDSTVIKEFSYNYYLPNTGCAWSEDERYCVLARWDDFRQNPNMWIDKAYEKRTDPIAAKTKVRP
ncbi:MAG: TIR domain-containing protein [Acidipropionibacterium acidipropionici]|uniref:TIR domain-containing protein n=1 Tax=Acidipropionibacterium acidipropionici TaxID=1748 RepID=UPI002F35E125